MRRIATAHRVDWFRVLADLHTAGMTNADVAVTIGVPRETLRAWKNRYTEPRHYDGCRLVVLWSALLRRAADEIPRT